MGPWQRHERRQRHAAAGGRGWPSQSAVVGGAGAAAALGWLTGGGGVRWGYGGGSGRAGMGDGAAATASHIRIVYDPASRWFTSDERGVAQRCAEAASAAGKGSHTYSVLVLDAWIAAFVGACAFIVGYVIWGDWDSMQARPTLLLVYLYALLTFSLSNGRVLRLPAPHVELGAHAGDDS